MALLKSLLNELGRSLRQGDVRPASAAATGDGQATNVAYGASGVDTSAGRIAEQRASFVTSDLRQRRQMCEALDTELRSRPGSLEELTMLGDWWLRIGQPSNAEPAYRQALQLKPMHAIAHEGLGLALLGLRQLDEAYLRLETATKLEPAHADAWIHWGLVELERRNLGSAGNKFQRAIDLAPTNPHGWHNLALVAMREGRVELCIERLQRALALKPDHGLAYSNLAIAQLHADRLGEAAEAAQRAIEFKHGNARVWVVLADVRLAQGQLDEAAAAVQRAHEIAPGDVNVAVVRGKLQLAQDEVEAAIESFEAALAIEPTHAEARAGLGQARLLCGQWAAGWPLYEARRETVTSPVRRLPLPEWQGEDCRGRTLLVHSEQGMGDVILFCSCLADLQARGARLVVDAPRRFMSLFQRSFAQAEVVCLEDIVDPTVWLATRSDIDLQVPMGSLPRWLRAQPHELPRAAGFLLADPQRVAYWRGVLAGDGSPVIGICWKGGLAITGKHQRSLTAEALASTIAATGARLVSLQHGDTREELEDLAARRGLQFAARLDGYSDFDELAALASACDGIVSVCSTLAHLTGALGRPGLVLVPHATNWRYGRAGERSPWYASLTLARQERASDWSAPLTRVPSWVGSLVRDTGIGSAYPAPGLN